MGKEGQAERLVDGQRGQRYGEVLAVFAEDSSFIAHVYGTQMINDCPQELWAALDVAAITEQLGALFIKLNGPRHWVIDGLGAHAAQGAAVEPGLASFGGLDMRRLAVVDLGTKPMAEPYTLRHVDRRAVFFFDAGKPVYELVDPEGTAYVMQAYCLGVDPTLNEEQLAGLGSRLALPEGWRYQTRILTEELVVDTSATVATVIQDELENSYTLPC